MPIATLQDFLVNTSTANDQLQPSVTQLADGRLFYVWSSEQISGTGSYQVRGRIVSADGLTSSGDFVVNSATSGVHERPNVTTLTDGRVVVTWDQSSGSAADIAYRIFNADGSAAGLDGVVNTTTLNPQGGSVLSRLSNGGFVVTWTSEEGGANGFDIRARVFSATGTAAGDFIVNSVRADAQEAPSVTQLSNGNLVFIWQGISGADIYASIRSSAGATVLADFKINSSRTGFQETPVISALANGGFFAAWKSNESATVELRGRYFDAAGNPVANDFIINNNSAQPIEQDPAVVVLKDGRVLVAWTASASLGADGDIRARMFNTDGTPAGDDFVINSSTGGSQTDPALKVLADGRVVASWTSAGEIRSTIINPLVFNGADSADTWSGGASAERLYGFGGADVLNGNDGADKIYGDAGLDILSGGTGNDLMYGGADNDSLFGNSGGDTIYGDAGNDTISSGSENDLIYGGAGADSINGGTGSDVVSYFFDGAVKVFLDGSGTNTGAATGDTLVAIERIYGSNTGSDELIGDGLANLIRGYGGNDTLSGGSGNDTLLGGSGQDRLIGGSGSDHFQFDSVSDSFDTIAAFTSIDFFVFKGSAFGNLAKGVLASAAFAANTTGVAQDTSDRFILETDTGKLRYDSNGSAAGGVKALIADVDGTFTMTAGDILII